MPEIWISRYDSEELFMMDESDSPYTLRTAAGPVEISNELLERIRECERERVLIQDILESLEYEWEYPDDEEIVRDCD